MSRLIYKILLLRLILLLKHTGAAALLGEAEQKLSQMMEVSGLKLASLQTLTQQFGGKTKEVRGKFPKTLASNKKDNIEEEDLKL